MIYVLFLIKKEKKSFSWLLLFPVPFLTFLRRIAKYLSDQ